MLYNLQKVHMLHRTQNIQRFVIRCICANLASYNILAGYALKLLVGYIANVKYVKYISKIYRLTIAIDDHDISTKRQYKNLF